MVTVMIRDKNELVIVLACIITLCSILAAHYWPHF